MFCHASGRGEPGGTGGKNEAHQSGPGAAAHIRR